MQEQIEQGKVKRAGFLNKKLLFPVGICCFLMLAFLISGMVLYRDLPTSHWRESHTEFPWEGSGVCISKIECHWQNSKGHERMELRAAFYPSAVITLRDKITGEGNLIVRFLDANASPCGQSIYLPYNEKGFVFKEDLNILAMDKEAAIHLEAGFRTGDEFYNHALAEEQPLWKVSIWNRPVGADEEEFLGYITIPATDKAK